MSTAAERAGEANEIAVRPFEREESGDEHDEESRRQRKRHLAEERPEDGVRLLLMRFSRQCHRQIADRLAEVIPDDLSDDDVSELFDSPAVVLHPIANRL